jgi:hypothetical protein
MAHSPLPGLHECVGAWEPLSRWVEGFGAKNCEGGKAQGDNLVKECLCVLGLACFVDTSALAFEVAEGDDMFCLREHEMHWLATDDECAD